MLVTEVLEELGYTAIEAADGASGLKVLESDVQHRSPDHRRRSARRHERPADGRRCPRERGPKLKVLFITGYAEKCLRSTNGDLEPGMEVMSKPSPMEISLQPGSA